MLMCCKCYNFLTLQTISVIIIIFDLLTGFFNKIANLNSVNVITTMIMLQFPNF